MIVTQPSMATKVVVYNSRGKTLMALDLMTEVEAGMLEVQHVLM